MIHDFIKMIDNIDFLYGFIYECANLINNKKKVICIFPQNRYKVFHEKIIKSYFNIWYIEFFYLLQKNIKLDKNIYNIGIIMNIFMNLYDNSGIDCNKKN